MNEKRMTRNYGIDALRIVSMLMIVILHVNGQGGVMWSVEPHSLRWYVVWFGEIAAVCCVNCYAMISGYVGGSTSRHYTNFVMLWLQVTFYTVGITAIFACVSPELVSSEQWHMALLPVTTRQYWYFTAYAIMYLFVPAFDKAIASLSRRQMQAMLAVLLTVGSLLPTIFNIDPVGLKGGYNAWWLMILYFLGGYVGKYKPLQNLKSIYLVAGFLISTGITWLAWCLFHNIAEEIVGFNGMISYTAPLVLIESVCLLLLFSKIRVEGKMQKIVKFFSPLSFSVYLIHVHPLVWNNIMPYRFEKYGSLSGVPMLLSIICTVLAIYIGCALIDFVRAKLFEVLGLKQRLTTLERKLLGTR